MMGSSLGKLTCNSHSLEILARSRSRAPFPSGFILCKFSRFSINSATRVKGSRSTTHMHRSSKHKRTHARTESRHNDNSATNTKRNGDRRPSYIAYPQLLRARCGRTSACLANTQRSRSRKHIIKYTHPLTHRTEKHGTPHSTKHNTFKSASNRSKKKTSDRAHSDRATPPHSQNASIYYITAPFNTYRSFCGVLMRRDDFTRTTIQSPTFYYIIVLNVYMRKIINIIAINIWMSCLVANII